MKVQVKIHPNGYFSFKTRKYRAGDILEVEPKDFNSEYMVVVEEPKPVVVEVSKSSRKRKVAPVESPAETAD
jgi:hypothetical protein